MQLSGRRKGERIRGGAERAETVAACVHPGCVFMAGNKAGHGYVLVAGNKAGLTGHGCVFVAEDWSRPWKGNKASNKPCMCIRGKEHADHV